MKILSHKDIEKLAILPGNCVDWVSEVFQQKDQTILPPKISLKQPGNIFYNTMPSIIPALNVFGVKVVSRYPERRPSLDSQIMIYNLETGNLDAILDGNWITAMRTGAVAALSAKIFAKSDWANISIFGLGNTARATLLSLISIFHNKEFTIRVKSYKDQAEKFIEQFDQNERISFIKCKSDEELISTADIIFSCVTAMDDLVGQNEWYQPGVLVIPVHTRGFQNCDLFFDKVFADDKGHVSGFKYFEKFLSFAELSQVLNGFSKGRENDTERILAYNIGISLHDIYFAKKVFDSIDPNNIDAQVDLLPPIEKFWVK